MAIVEIRQDDIDSTTGPEVKNVQFLSDGFTYEIDLKPEHREELETAIQKLINAGARRVTGSAAKSTGSKPDLNAVRAWAKEQGMEVSERGRVKAEILEAYANRKH